MEFKEVKVEVIKNVHPYEVPLINVSPLINDLFE